MARATFYRRTQARQQPPQAELLSENLASRVRALRAEERTEVIETLNSSRFVDLAPREVYATLLDEGRYLCSVSTMYRLLRVEDQVRERRNQLQHPQYKKPELLATQPNQVWGWDITKLLGPAKWTCFYLYVIFDIFSRYVVGWMVAPNESAILAERLIEESCHKQQIQPQQLTLHADRGSSMKSKPVAMLLADLGVRKTHSRPHVSNDNPYSESQFKTMKYRPEFPSQFSCIEEARGFCVRFFGWYNQEHHHSGIALLTPEVVHYGKAEPCWRRAGRCCWRPTKSTLKDFRAGCHERLNCPRRCGSIRPQRVAQAKNCSLNSMSSCLNSIDTFRFSLKLCQTSPLLMHRQALNRHFGLGLGNKSDVL